MHKARVQGVNRALQRLYGRRDRLDRLAIGVKGGIVAVEMILNERIQVAVVQLVGDLLPWFQIELRLVESAAEALAVLRNESWNQAAGHDGGDQQEAVE